MSGGVAADSRGAGVPDKRAFLALTCPPVNSTCLVDATAVWVGNGEGHSRVRVDATGAEIEAGVRRIRRPLRHNLRVARPIFA